MVDVATDVRGEGVCSEMLYADCLVLMSETIERFKYEFTEWKDVTFVSMSLRVNLGKTKLSQCRHHTGWLV